MKYSVPPVDSVEYRVGILIARHRYGPGLDMGGKHNPTPTEWALARQITEMARHGYTKHEEGISMIETRVLDHITEEHLERCCWALMEEEE